MEASQPAYRDSPVSGMIPGLCLYEKISSRLPRWFRNTIDGIGIPLKSHPGKGARPARLGKMFILFTEISPLSSEISLTGLARLAI